MSAVTIDEAWPGFGGPFTVAELDRMPDDGRRYELLDGVLVVSPRPTTVRQFVMMRLANLLDDACETAATKSWRRQRPRLPSSVLSL